MLAFSSNQHCVQDQPQRATSMAAYGHRRCSCQLSIREIIWNPQQECVWHFCILHLYAGTHSINCSKALLVVKNSTGFFSFPHHLTTTPTCTPASTSLICSLWLPTLTSSSASPSHPPASHCLRSSSRNTSPETSSAYLRYLFFIWLHWL